MNLAGWKTSESLSISLLLFIRQSVRSLIIFSFRSFFYHFSALVRLYSVDLTLAYHFVSLSVHSKVRAPIFVSFFLSLVYSFASFLHWLSRLSVCLSFSTLIHFCSFFYLFLGPFIVSRGGLWSVRQFLVCSLIRLLDYSLLPSLLIPLPSPTLKSLLCLITRFYIHKFFRSFIRSHFSACVRASVRACERVFVCQSFRWSVR